MYKLSSIPLLGYKSDSGVGLLWRGDRYVEAFSNELTPEAFGAPLFGDATDALENMFASVVDGDVIRLSRVLDTTRPLVCNANNITILSDTQYTRAAIRCSVPGTQILTLGGFGVKIDGVGFHGDAVGSAGAGATVKGVRFVRSDGSKDVDSEIRNSTFVMLAEGVFAQGTNLRVTNTLFGTSLIGVSIAANGSDECRGHRINGNRFHNVGGLSAAGKCVVLDPAAFACEVKSNYADALYVFYHGPANNIHINENVIFKCASTAINQISGTVSGWQDTGTICNNAIYKNSPSYEISNGITARLRNGVISGNTIIGPRAHGISLIGATSNVISGNVVISPNYNSATDGSVYDGIYGDGQSIGNVITSNIIRSAGIPARSAINVYADNIMEMNKTDPTYATRYYQATPTLGVF